MRSERIKQAALTAVFSASILGMPIASAATGAEIYAAGCVACHAAGVLEAPKLGVSADWEARRSKGIDKLVENAIKGINSMPPKGGNPALSDADIRAAVEYMLAESSSTPAKPAVAEAASKQQKSTTVAQAQPAATSKGSPSAPAKAEPKPKAKPKKKKARRVNTFNRLMKPPSQRNLPPMKDGIHDPSNDGTGILQHPREAFAPLPKANTGNRVDWVSALDKGDIAPWFDLEDESRKPVVLDLNIVREVKGTMPDVVYPHKQHTEWLDCSNCHPSIFFPKKGANNISMASILLGESCGVCHGKVAFPVSDCRRCHSKKKPRVAKK